MASLLQKSINLTSRKGKELDAVPTIMLTDKSDEGNSPVALTRKMERWKCDICCVQTFPTKEECISHEEICSTHRETQKQEPEKKLHPFFQHAKRKPSPLAEQNRPKKSKANKPTKDQNVIVIDDTSTSETMKNVVAPASFGNVSRAKPKSTTKNNDLQEMAAALGVSPESLLAEQKAVERQADRIKHHSSGSAKTSSLEAQSSISHWKTQFSYGTGKNAKKQKTVATSSRTKESKPMAETTNHELNALATALGVDPASLLAEQKVLEDQANRQKNKACNEHKSSRNEQAAASLTPTILHDSMKRHKGSAPLFPRPNHVNSLEDDSVLSSEVPVQDWLTVDRRRNMNSRWSIRCSERVQNRDYEPIPCLNGNILTWGPKTNTTEEKLFDLLSKNLQIMPNRILSTELWVDRFRMKQLPMDLCGNRHQLSEIESFLKEWKEARKKCLTHMASKYIKTKKTSKAKKYKDDDDDWKDSDNEEDFGLPSLCVVSGPVGCGKSDLVRAVVESHDCRLFEINTTEKRGAAALKKSIGEATQSLSSSELMRNSKKNSMYGIRTVDDTEHDTGSSLTAILLDEVDILFENNGDKGFWQSLHELSKKSKSPIFLTANNINEPPSFYCEYVQMERPRPEECTTHLRRCIQESSAFRFLGQSEAEQDKFLIEFARLCGRDMRKAAHELQAFSHSNLQASHVVDLSMDDSASMVTTASSCNKQDCFGQRSVSYVHPSRVDSDHYSLLEITGTGFSSFARTSGTSGEMESDSKRGIPVTVCVGDRQCAVAQILNDNTIMAVCPPRLPEGRECSRSIFYEPIQICSTQRAGITSTSLGCFVTQTLQDGSTILTEQVPVNVQYFKIMGATQANQSKGCGNESDEEFEFKDEDIVKVDEERACSHIPHEEASRILQDGIDAWLSRHPERPEFNSHPANMMLVKSGIEELSQLCADTELFSDAAFLEDVGLDGLPYPSGSTLGIGYNLTEAYPLCSNETNKRPSESTLFQTGWKDDCAFYGSPDAFMTRPLTRTERRLIFDAEKSERGLALPEQSVKNDDTEDSEKDVAPTVRVDAEDAYLPNLAPISLMSLPYDLRNSRSESGDTNAYLGTQEARFEKAKLIRQGLLQALHSTIFAEEIQPPLLFFAVLHRTFHALLPERLQIDKRFYLDYLPFLRCLAVFDRAAVHSFQTGKSNNTETSKHSSKKRATRQTARKRFSHLWEAIVPPSVWKKNDDDGNNVQALELTGLLADLAMYSSIASSPKEI